FAHSRVNYNSPLKVDDRNDFHTSSCRTDGCCEVIVERFSSRWLLFLFNGECDGCSRLGHRRCAPESGAYRKRPRHRGSSSRRAVAARGLAGGAGPFPRKRPPWRSAMPKRLPLPANWRIPFRRTRRALRPSWRRQYASWRLAVSTSMPAVPVLWHPQMHLSMPPILRPPTGLPAPLLSAERLTHLYSWIWVRPRQTSFRLSTALSLRAATPMPSGLPKVSLSILD